MFLFGRKKVKSDHVSSFAEQLLDLEIELNMQLTLPTVKKLSELYSSAIEFYAPRQDPKYLHYQERLSILLGRKDVLALLDGEKSANILKEKRAVSSRSNQVNLSHERSAEKTVESHYVSNIQTSKRLRANIQRQNSAFLSRMVKRQTQKNNSHHTFERDLPDKYANRKSQVKNIIQQRYNSQVAVDALEFSDEIARGCEKIKKEK